ncbi:hypothetical protein B8033_28225 [Klebsiella pneumoniae]|nr:hypothetical protein B8033_28225 [Klebsiella pneumoniae]
MLKKTALSCAASAFTAVPGRDCHQQPSSHNPHNPSTTCRPPRGQSGICTRAQSTNHDAIKSTK